MSSTTAETATPVVVSDLAGAALQWTALCRVVPCAGKNPGLVGHGWQQAATRDADIVRAWWRRWPTANVGIVPGRDVLPVDVDRPQEWEEFQREHGAVPPTPIYLTGGAPGRMRLILAHPGVELRDSLCPGVQLRDGERVSIAPPSVNPASGERYEWVAALDEVPMAPMPTAWLGQARKPVASGTGRSVRRPASEWVEHFCRDYVAGCGEAHPATMSMAAYLVRKLGSGQLALELLLAWNERRCKPPKPEHEIVEQVRWAVRREAGR